LPRSNRGVTTAAGWVGHGTCGPLLAAIDQFAEQDGRYAVPSIIAVAQTRGQYRMRFRECRVFVEQATERMQLALGIDYDTRKRFRRQVALECPEHGVMNEFWKDSQPDRSGRYFRCELFRVPGGGHGIRRWEGDTTISQP
jgi:hypothetical protein